MKRAFDVFSLKAKGANTSLDRSTKIELPNSNTGHKYKRRKQFETTPQQKQHMKMFKEVVAFGMVYFTSHSTISLPN